MIVKSVCIYCGCGCKLNFSVEKNKIKGVFPDKEDRVSEGKPCLKGLTINEVVDKGRIVCPMVRKGKKFKKVDWEKAFELIHKKTKKLLPDEIFFAASGKITNEDNFLIQKFARLVFQTNNIDACCSRVCHAATVKGLEEMFGTKTNPWRFDEIFDRDCILIIGSNPASNYPVLFNKLLRAKERGTRILSIQPVLNLTSRYADKTLISYPGTEVVLLNGIMNLLIERGSYEKDVEKIENFKELFQILKEFTVERVCEICKVKKEDFLEFTEEIANSKAFGLMHGMGLTQHVNAIENVHSLFNLLLLKDGKLLSSRGEVNVQGAGDMACSPLALPVGSMVNFDKLEKLWGRKITIERGKNLIESFLISPAKAVFISGFNPAHSLPNLKEVHKNLRKMFLVQLESYFNLTSKFAQVILPTPVLIERRGTITNGEGRVRLVNKVVEPLGEAKPEWQIFKELSGYFGLEKFFNYKEEKEIFREIVEIIPSYSSIDPDFVYAGNDAWTDKEIKFKKFVPEKFEGVEDVRSKRFPFILTTFRSPYRFLSDEATSKSKTLKKFDVEKCFMSKKDAKKLGIKNGDRVRISSIKGSLVTRVEIDESMTEGTIGIHFHSEKLLVNKLFPTEFDEETFTPNYKLLAINVKKVS
jgi:formate dehydrogenase major subunit